MVNDIATTKEAIAELPEDAKLLQCQCLAFQGTKSDVYWAGGDSLKNLAADHDRLLAENAELTKTAPLRQEKLNQLIHYRNETKRLITENAELVAALEQIARPALGGKMQQYTAQAVLAKVRGKVASTLDR